MYRTNGKQVILFISYLYGHSIRTSHGGHAAKIFLKLKDRITAVVTTRNVNKSYAEPFVNYIRIVREQISIDGLLNI